MAVNETLKKLGLNDKEIKIYLTLLKHGKTKPSSLSSLTKINRATVYNLVNGLLSKGLIAEDLTGKTLYLTPLPPKNLEKILDQQKRELKEREALIKKAIGELSMITPASNYPVPKIQFVEEGNLEKFLYDNILKWQKSMFEHDATWWGFQDHSLLSNYEEYIHFTWQTSYGKHKDFKVKLLGNSAKIEDKVASKYLKSRRDIRFVEGMNFTSTVWVMGDYIAMVATGAHPFYLFEIHDQTLAHNMREVFKKLWEKTQ
ncbi:MAG: helix-turn-helix domain-containing protein [Candidatus Pacebacteria bacterium]|nr:helix-turn-helix domain-containing protein [Candidatus Paceibacterota bacterium]MDD5356797.1 helix-turn-helix domain-containing protein [Candidatus Paceibacterota bacterium]